ncbi:MAG: 4-hydroxy-tetrahydrodipicolinate reductase [Longimicrobiales bacterium]
MAVRICVSGATGRMGRQLARLAAERRDQFEIVGGIARNVVADPEEVGYPSIEAMESAGTVLSRAEVWIDFSAPEQLGALLESHAGAIEDRALVVGTTGLEPWIVRRLDELAGRTAVLLAANFSVGVNLLLALVERAAAALPAAGWDAEIVETHHRHKTDAPSGTALALGEAVAHGRDTTLSEKRRDGRSGQVGARPAGEIAFHALRGGEVTGEHRVSFFGARERVELTHRAEDRSLFADGALMAAAWIAGKPPGLYTMREVLGI